MEIRRLAPRAPAALSRSLPLADAGEALACTRCGSAYQGDPTLPLSERRAILIAGDDAEAKQVVTDLIEELGFAVVDTGPLSGSSIQEPGSAVYAKDLTTLEVRELREQ